jgi:hypothetical protein
MPERSDGSVAVGWSARSEPLAACACIARGPAARALGRALLAWEPARLARITACAGEGVLVVLGDGSELPWVDGITYLGRDQAAPHLLLPTSRRPDVPVDLFARALAARLPAGSRAVAVLPDGDGLLWIPVAAAGPVERASLEAWTAAP